MKPVTKRQTEEPLDLFPEREAKQRTESLLRNLLSTPPQPHTPKAKAAKRRSKKK